SLLKRLELYQGLSFFKGEIPMARSRSAPSLKQVLLKQEGSVAEIRLNRPQSLNAINVELATDLGRALKRLSEDSSVRAVILRGAGRAFSAGGDLKMFHEHLPRADRVFRKISGLLNQAIRMIRTMPKPVI